ncbi:MAG: hypothetical protein H5T69_06285 [Chloroflexi bacterium]|nr:hypothetical protein [Chloroflexota bacterium]
MALFRQRKRTPIPPVPVRYHSIIAWCKSHVSACVIELGVGSAQLLGVATVPVHGISRTGHPDIERWFAGCDHALTQAEDMTVHSCGHKIVPDYVTMCMPGEITRSLSIVVHQRRQEPASSITLEEAERLLHRGYRKAQDVVGVRGGGRQEDIIHGAVSRILLDGQGMVDLLGMRGEAVELHMNFAVAPLEWLRTLEIIAQRLELHLVGVLPDHVALASPLSDPAALLMILDADHTRVGLVSRGNIVWITLVETGQREILRETVRGLQLSGRNADLVLRAYREGRLRREVEETLVVEFWRALRQWMGCTARQIKALAGEEPLPHRIYFLDATRQLPEARQCLETPFWEAQLPFDACPEVIELDAGRVHHVMDCTTQAAGPHYVPVRALAYYVANLYQEDNKLAQSLFELVRRELDRR